MCFGRRLGSVKDVRYVEFAAEVGKVTRLRLPGSSYIVKIGTAPCSTDYDAI